MSVEVNGTTYTSDEVTSAIKQGNTKLTSGSSGELSEKDMNDIIAYANGKGIQVIPLFNAPGHMYTAVNAMNTLGVGGKYIKVSSPTDGRTSNWAVDPTDATAVAFAEALLQKYVTYFAGKGSTMFNIGADESGLDKDNYASYAKMVNDMNAIVKAAGMTTLAYNDGIYNTAYAESQPDVTFDSNIVICYWTAGANSASVETLLTKKFKILNNTDNWYYVLGDYLYNSSVWGSNGQWGYEDALNGIKSTPVTQMKNYTGNEKPMGSILCVWCDGPSVGYTTGYGYKATNQTNQQSVYNLIKAMAENNPDYFTGKVKLSASDDATDVSVAVTGTKGQKATVEVKKITSDFPFDTEAHVSYNVTPAVDGKAYTGEGTVTLPVPEGWATEDSRIRAYIIDNGAVKLISGTLSDGKYTFQVPHFSEMGLLQVESGEIVNVTVSEGGTKVVTINGKNYAGSYETTDPTIATVTVTGQNASTKTTYEKQSNITYSMLLNKDADNWTDTGYCYLSSGQYYHLYAKRSSYYYSYYNYSFAYGESDNNPTAIGSQVGTWSPSSDKPSFDVYSPSGTESVPAFTKITFKGLKQGGPVDVTIGDTIYRITVTEKKNVEIPISIIDYRADGLLFDYSYAHWGDYPDSYRYSLVHGKSIEETYYSTFVTASKDSNGLYYIDGTNSNVEKIAGTRIEQTRTPENSNYVGKFNSNNMDNSWSRAGLVQERLGSNGMPVYTDAAVKYVASLLAKGYYNDVSDSKFSCNTLLKNTFLTEGASRSVLASTAPTDFSENFRNAKTYANISNAYDLAWYLLNTIYQADTNMTTVTGTDKAEHQVPIYGMAVDAYKSIILSDDGNGTYSFEAGYSNVAGHVNYDRDKEAIYEDTAVAENYGFYPLENLGYEQPGLLKKTSIIDGQNRNGGFTLRGESQFVYKKDANLYFTFTGDDDVYMYINGVLAMDLGGAHGRNSKTVNLNDLDATKYGLKEGQVATFTFFYMERCSDASTFGIKTNMELVQRDINVEKKAYDTSYVNEYASGTAVINGTTVAYDLIVTNKSNSPMTQIKLTDTDSLGGNVTIGSGVDVSPVVTPGKPNDKGTVALGQGNGYVLFITDSNGAEVKGSSKSPSSLQALSDEIAGLTLPAGQSLHVRFLTAKTEINESKILDYINTVEVSAKVGGQALSDTASHELYSYNAKDTGRTYVVDFGLPLEITGIFDTGAQGNIGEVSLSPNNVQKYGTVTIAPNGFNTTLTYTRTADKTINEPETITLDVVYKIGNSKIKLEKTLTIIPASNVYYEDSLAAFTDGSGVAQNAVWSTVGNDDKVPTEQTDVYQALEELGKGDRTPYGNDDAYNSSSKLSMGTAHKVTVTSAMLANWEKNDTTSAWPTASFTFKGTGFDIISLTDNTSGAIMVTVEGVTDTTYKKNFLVNNYYGYAYDKDKNEWVTVASGDSNAIYQIPVMKVNGIPYGEYKVTIGVLYNSLFDKTGNSAYSFWLDAVRIYDPMGEYTGYTQDNEGYPQYIKLHDEVVSNDVTVTNALFIDGEKNATIQQYTNLGPNNEVYLMKGQAITFKLTGDTGKIASVQIGAKAPKGTVELKVNDSVVVEKLSTATEMYYDITTQATGGSSQVTITNTTGNILSLTNLKITFKEKPTGEITLAALNTQEQESAVSLVRALFTAPVATFSPETFEADWGRAVRAGKRATLTVKTSADVESITVDGQAITSYTTRTQRTGWGWWSPKVTYHVFTYTITAPAQTTDYAVCAVNAEGTASEAVTATLTVKPTTWWNWWF